MRFCIDCGKAVAIFDNSAADLCIKCANLEATTKIAKKTNTIDLNSATFSTENGKLILQSKEGWLLWSGNIDGPHSFQAITEKATRILHIRKKRKK